MTTKSYSDMVKTITLASHSSFGILQSEKNLGQENPQTSVCDYADYWLPEKGNFFWVIDNCASDPMSIGTASTLMLAIGDLFNGFDQYCRD